jgi:lipopolysaccharide/colanic/teichoic acid biosynthesis glycosyltransferase
MKRALDILGGLCGAVLLVPLTILAGAAILLESGWPVFVRLERVSKGKSIRVWKFRSMERSAAEAKESLMAQNERSDGPFFKMRHDPRVTRVGRVLRKFRLDEVPQFLNVLTGDLSLVGPRPHEPGEVSQYPPEYRELARAQAGLTGLSQVSGASGLPFLKELELDRYYLTHQSFWLDLRILGKTFWIFITDPTGV